MHIYKLIKDSYQACSRSVTLPMIIYVTVISNKINIYLVSYALLSNEMLYK